MAATILVKVPEDQLFDPAMVHRILRVLTLAFPNYGDETRLSAMPYLSLYLLRRMEVHVDDAGCRQRIADMIAKLQAIQDAFLDRAAAAQESSSPPSTSANE